MIVVITEAVAGRAVTDCLRQMLGVAVRSHDLGGNIIAGLRTIISSEIKEYTSPVRDTRRQAIGRLVIANTVGNLVADRLTRSPKLAYADVGTDDSVTGGAGSTAGSGTISVGYGTAAQPTVGAGGGLVGRGASSGAGSVSADTSTSSADVVEEIVVTASRQQMWDTAHVGQVEFNDIDSQFNPGGFNSDPDNINQENAAIHQAAVENLFMGSFAPVRSLISHNYYAGERPSGMRSFAGKIAASPYTVVGAVAGFGNLAVGLVRGNSVSIKLRDNSIQFIGGGIGQNKHGNISLGGSGAITIGNSQIYSGSINPESPDRGYIKSTQLVRVGDHEEGHTYQYERYGLLFPLFYLKNGLQSPRNPFEIGADLGARGGNPAPDPRSLTGK